MGKKIQCIGRYVMDGVTLGKGNFAHVELATHGTTQVKVAIKIIDTRKIKDEYVRTNLHREARIMASLRHPNIIRLYETLKAATLYCLVTEHAAGGELLAYIKNQKECRLGESPSRVFIRQLVSAVDYLHKRGVVHRDLKMENIMLDEKKKNIKLIDFGLSNIYKEDDPLRTHCGSPEYAAPELFVVGKTYGPEIDIWSLGIITYAMILGRLPFCSPFHDEYQRQRMLQQIQKGLSASHEHEMQILTSDCRNLLHQLIEPNPELRIPLSEIECHPWITKNGKCPFSPFTIPPRNKTLRNQVIGELAYLTEMKKGVINETVKENRADELSAMFNMLMDKKKKDLGFYDIDHTRKAQKDSRSRSKEGDKSSTPESTRTTATLIRRGVCNNKKVLETRGNISARPSKMTLDPNPSDSRRLSSSTKDQMPGNSTARGHSSSGNRETSQPRPLQPPPPIDPQSKIPMSQRRVPPAKLNLTLDLSVTNLSTFSKNIDGTYGNSSKPEHGPDTSCGFAASSGVPPRLSPKDEAKNIHPASVAATAQNTPKKPVAVVAEKSSEKRSSLHHSVRRPSTLQYCLRSKPSEPIHKQVVAEEAMLAPTATPEDSLIDSCSSVSSEENRRLGTVLELMEDYNFGCLQSNDLLKVESFDKVKECLVIKTVGNSAGSDVAVDRRPLCAYQGTGLLETEFADSGSSLICRQQDVGIAFLSLSAFDETESSDSLIRLSKSDLFCDGKSGFDQETKCDLSIPCEKSTLSDACPTEILCTPSNQQGKFSRTGAHALDVFFSPEEVNTPAQFLWRPVATTIHDSPTLCRSVPSSDQEKLGVPGCRAAAASSHISSLDGFFDEDDDVESYGEKNFVFQQTTGDSHCREFDQPCFDSAKVTLASFSIQAIPEVISQQDIILPRCKLKAEDEDRQSFCCQNDETADQMDDPFCQTPKKESSVQTLKDEFFSSQISKIKANDHVPSQTILSKAQKIRVLDSILRRHKSRKGSSGSNSDAEKEDGKLSDVKSNKTSSSWRKSLSHFLQFSHTTGKWKNNVVTKRNSGNGNGNGNGTHTKALLLGGKNPDSSPIECDSNTVCKIPLNLSNSLPTNRWNNDSTKVKPLILPGTADETIESMQYVDIVYANAASTDCNKFDNAEIPRSPLPRLKVRKVQWQECQQHARSDHSSEENCEQATIVNSQ